ncbi:hypothetical protein EDD21DRAFT_350118 [Dissophora ornata]|nr:hypothetical protein EDD21DRAFT_350118 [Dissophora ornata]
MALKKQRLHQDGWDPVVISLTLDNSTEQLKQQRYKRTQQHFQDWTRARNFDPSVPDIANILLGLYGFLRPSDIYGINIRHSRVINGLLALHIVIPKERRRGYPLERAVFISPHSDVVICPAAAYLAHCTQMFDHPLLTSRKKSPIQYQPLVRWVDIPTKVMSAQRISSIIAGLTNFMDLPKATHRLKLRALGATLAVLGNISMDDIKVHGNWSSTAITDQFYRLNRSTATNFTSSLLT